jgi:hypothetical protein
MWTFASRRTLAVLAVSLLVSQTGVVRALAAVPELGQGLDGRLVLLQIEPLHQHPDWISRGCWLAQYRDSTYRKCKE